MALATIKWDVNPEAFSIGFITVRWYGLLYAMGFLLGITILGKIFKRENCPEDWADKVFIYMVLAVVIGARLGHVFFYAWDYYKDNLLEIVMIWHGGLASHGGAIAMLIAAWIFSKKVSKKSFLWLGDRLFIPSAMVAGLIRIGNDLFYDPISGMLLKEKEQFFLTKKERLLFEYFLRQKNRVLSFEELEEAIWAEEGGSKEALKSLVKELRKNLYKVSIENVFGIGYKLVLH